MKMLSRGVSSALVFAVTCLLDTSKAFMLATKTSISSSNSNGINNNNNKWTNKVDNSHKVPVGSNSGFGASLLLPHVKGFGAESVVNLPRVPSAIDHAQRKSRGNSCPPLHFGLHDVLADFQEHGQCGGVTPTREGEMEGMAVVVEEEEKEEETVEEEVVVLVEEEVAVEVDEKEVVMVEKKRLLSWLRKKAKKSAAAAAEGEVEEVGEKRGPVSWLRKKVFRRTKTSAVADGATAAAAPTAPAAPAHDLYLRIAVQMMSMDQRLALIAWGTTNT